MAPVILWFRRNLRLRDNAALLAAADSGRPIIPVYISDALDTGGASRWWLHHSLASLDRDLQKHGAPLVVRRGSPVEVLREICARSGAAAVYFARRYEPQCREDEQRLRAGLDERIDLHGYDDSLLHHPAAVLTRSDTPYKVFTPFRKAAAGRGAPPRPEPPPASIAFADHALESLEIADLELLPMAPDWAGGLRETWKPGESGALDRVDALEGVVANYNTQRDRPDLDSTSRLSPHLHFGEISVRQVWHAVRSLEQQLQSSTGAEALLRQLYWRDFSAYLLYHFPALPETPLRAEFERFPWSDNQEHLRAWQRGMTGYPIVDAGMRQLWATGWMHNRVRMIVASFLVKHLLIPWQTGADWFLDTLVDADLANNSASWQWVAGCGADAAPYFRIFNPVTQGKKFDPEGTYVRHYVPELAELPAKYIHAPWEAPADVLKDAGVNLGDTYPEPIVELKASRERALAAFKSLSSPSR